MAVVGRLDENNTYANEAIRNTYERVDQALSTIRKEGLLDPNVVEFSRAQADKYRAIADAWSSPEGGASLTTYTDAEKTGMQDFYRKYALSLDRVATWVEDGCNSEVSKEDFTVLAVLVLSTNVPEAEECNRRFMGKSHLFD